MATYKTVAIDLPGSRELAELNGIVKDLEWVEEACSRLLELQKSSRPDSFLIEAISSAALVRYARCFVSGVRPRLPEELSELLPAEWKEIYDYYINLRQKHVAHSVNAYEENTLTVAVPETLLSDFSVTSLGFYHQRLIGLDSPENLKNLAEMMRSVVEEVLAQEKAEILIRVQAIPLSQLMAKDLLSVRVVDPKSAGKRR